MSNLPVVRSEETAVVALRRLMPDATDSKLAKWAERCECVGLVGQKLDQALELVDTYETSLQSIVNWMRQGWYIQEIELGLEYRDQHDFVDSMNLIMRYIRIMRLQCDESYYELFETFAEVAEMITTSGRCWPLHRLLYSINEAFMGNFMVAYDYAVYDPDMLIAVIAKRARDRAWEWKEGKNA